MIENFNKKQGMNAIDAMKDNLNFRYNLGNGKTIIHQNGILTKIEVSDSGVKQWFYIKEKGWVEA